MSKRITPTTHSPDKLLIAVTAALVIFGVIMVYNASVVESYNVFGGKYHFLINQAIWAAIGAAAALFASGVDYRRLGKLAFPSFVIALILLILVLIPGIGSKILGARRRLSLGPIGFQPSEFAKLATVFYFSSLFSKKSKSKNHAPQGFFSFLFILSLVVGLVILEPDFGTAVVIGIIGMLIYFFSGASVAHFIIGLPPLMLAAVGFILVSPYRRQRLLTFLDPSSSDPFAAGYQIKQVLIALGSGGLLGLGLGHSRQKYEYLPEATTDSIFAIMGEELGFVGTLLVVLAFALLIYRGFKIARQSSDEFGRLLAAGVVSWIGIQVLVNLMAMTALIPLTGIPLPLISYGGSSMVFTMGGIGLLLSVSRYTEVGKKRRI